MDEYWNTMILSEKATLPRLEAVKLNAPGPGMVLVRLRAAALNFADLLMRKGTYQDTPPLPFVPGMEGSGEVLSVGAGVDLAPGTRVAVFGRGTMAEANMFPAANCLPIPDAMSHAQAAGFLIAYGTSHLALQARANLRPGETLAVLGAAGGVGLTAVEIGAAMGARVIAIARGADKLAVARAAGAAETINSDACPDLKAALRAMGGVDVVYDPVGDTPGEAAFGALRPGGRFIVIGFAAGKPPQLPLNHALVKNLTIHGLYWGGYDKLDPAALRASINALFAMFQAGQLAPHVGATVPLERLSEGYALLESRRAIGKIIVTI